MLQRDVWVSIWGNIFFIALSRTVGPVSLFPPAWLWLSPVCHVGLAYSSVFLWSFFISKSLLTKKIVFLRAPRLGDTPRLCRMREGECLGQWGPPLSLSSERVKDWSLSSRYPRCGVSSVPLRSEDSSTRWRICSNWATGTFVVSLLDFSEHNGCGMTWSAAAPGLPGTRDSGRETGSE